VAFEANAGPEVAYMLTNEYTERVFRDAKNRPISQFFFSSPPPLRNGVPHCRSSQPPSAHNSRDVMDAPKSGRAKDASLPFPSSTECPCMKIGFERPVDHFALPLLFPLPPPPPYSSLMPFSPEIARLASSRFLYASPTL